MRVLAKTSNTPTIAISVNISAFNIANSGGAAIGGAATALDVGYPRLGPLAAILVTVALSVTLYSGRLDRSNSDAPHQ